MPYHTPDNAPFTIVRGHRCSGMTITIPDDIKEYELEPRQRFIPHVIKDKDHPAKTGDIVEIPSYINWHLQVKPSYGFVSRTRTIQRCRSRRGIGSRVRQIEIMGWPCQWFDLWSFSEYSGKTQVKDFHTSIISAQYA